MLDFREVLVHYDLHDIGFLRLPWTYDNKQKGDRNVRVRLDRAVASPNWSQWFPYVKVQHIISTRSNHYPILLDLVKVDRLQPNQRLMRYEIMWEHEESLPEEIKIAWEQGVPIHNLNEVANRLNR
jgi:hypothetical protein